MGLRLFVVVTASFRVLYVFVVLSLGRRRVVDFGVTENPSAAWTAQRLVEATIDADHVPRFLIHDRDSIYGGEFRARVRGLGTRRLVIPPRAPQANSFCERMIGTLRRDCLDHVIIWNARHAERVLRQYTTYYLGRPHRGLGMQPPDGARHLPPPRPPPGTRIRATRSSVASTIGTVSRPHRRSASVSSRHTATTAPDRRPPVRPCAPRSRRAGRPDRV